MKRLLVVAAAIAALCLLPSSAFATAVDSRVAFWRLDETSGTTATDSIGSNDGTYNSGVTLGEPGATSDGDKSAKFSGTTGGYVGVPDSNALDLGDDFSIETWFKREAGGNGDQSLIGKGDQGYLLWLTGNKLTLRKVNVGNIVQSTVTSTVDGRWHHVVATKSGSNAHIYLDGVDVSGTVTNQTIANNTAALNIGVNLSGDVEKWKGWLDDVALYDRALTPNEVSELDQPDPYSARVALWRLNETSGTSAADAEGGNNGTYNSGVTLGEPGAVPGDKSARFSGTTGGYVGVPDANALDLGDDFSIETWFKREAGGNGDQSLIGKGDQGYLLWLTGNKLTLRKVNVGNIVQSTVTSTVDGEWHHVVATKAGANAHIYLDGVDVSGTVTNQTIANNTAALNIGVNLSGDVEKWKGWLDDVALYSRALTPAEVAELNQPDPFNARVAFWRLNETSGTTAADSIASNDGTYNSGVTLGEAGGTSDGDKSAKFSGTTGGYVGVPDAGALDLGNDFSIETWFKREAGGNGDQSLIGKGDQGYLLWLTGNKLTLRKVNVGNIVQSTVTSTVDGAWHHVVATKAGNDAHIYLDGVDVSGPVTSRTVSDTTAALNIGVNLSGDVEKWKGWLDDVALYDRALTPGEVGRLYTPDLRAARTAFWRLDETTGTNADDWVATHDGTYTGGYSLGQTGGTADGNKAVHLNGSSGAITTAYNPFQNGVARTFDGWAYRDDTTGHHTLLAGTGSRAPELYLESGSTQMTFSPDVGASSSSVSWTGIPTASWFHWALVFDESANTAELFVNGVSKGIRTVTTPYNATPGNLQLGDLGAGSYFKGSLDDVAVYNRVLGLDELEQLAVPVTMLDSFEGSSFPQVFSSAAWNAGKLFGSTFETGERIDQATPSGFSASNGTKVVDAELPTTGDRAEIQCHRSDLAFAPPNLCAGAEGSEFTYDFDFRVPSGYTLPGRATILMQTKPNDAPTTGCYGGGLSMAAVPGDSSRIDLSFASRAGDVIDDGHGFCTTSIGTSDPLGAVTKDVWHHFKLHARWSTNADDGFVQVWVDDHLALPLRHQATLLNGTGRIQMFRLGLYESKNPTDYHTDFRAFYDDLAIRKDG